MKAKITVTVVVMAIAFLYSHSAYAQREPPSNTISPGWKIKPVGCERNNIILEQADREAGDTIIVLIGRPGSKEKRDTSVKRRLYTARAYLTEYLEKRNIETIATGEAPNKGSEYGTIEIYVKGLLFDVLATHPNSELGLGSCDSLESDDRESRAKRTLLYPWLFKKGH